MSALTAEAFRQSQYVDQILLPLSVGAKCFKNGIACIDTGTGGEVEPGAAETDQIAIGVFLESFDNSAGSVVQMVAVQLFHPFLGFWFKNATAGDAVVAADIGEYAYVLDDQTVTITSTGHSKVGRVWGVSAVKGVLIEGLYPA